MSAASCTLSAISGCRTWSRTIGFPRPWHAPRSRGRVRRYPTAVRAPWARRTVGPGGKGASPPHAGRPASDGGASLLVQRDLLLRLGGGELGLSHRERAFPLEIRAPELGPT